jgi:hypothetical protein
LSTFEKRSEARRSAHPYPVQVVAGGRELPPLPVEIAGALAEIQRNVAILAQALKPAA